MSLKPKPILSWREPVAVTRARRATERNTRLLKWTMIAFAATGTGATLFLAKAEGLTFPRETALQGILALAYLLPMVVLWIRAGMPLTVRLRPGVEDSKPVRAPAAVAIVRHPMCLSHRVLLMMYADGRMSFVGVADDVSDDDLRRAWAQSDWGDVPLQSSDRGMVFVWERVDPGKLIFTWPDVPSYWPFAWGNRGRIVRGLAALIAIPPLAAAIGVPVLKVCDDRLNLPQLRSLVGWNILGEDCTTTIVANLVVAVIFAVAVCILLFLGALIIGSPLGWVDRTVRVGEGGICFFGGLHQTTGFAWRDVRAVVVTLLPHGSNRPTITVIHDFYGIERAFAVRMLSIRFDYERFVKALGTLTDGPPQATESPDGVTIRLTGFAEKAASSGRDEYSLLGSAGSLQSIRKEDPMGAAGEAHG